MSRSHPSLSLVLLGALALPSGCALYDASLNVSDRPASDLGVDLGADLGADMAPDMPADPCAACPDTCVTTSRGGMCPGEALRQRCLAVLPSARPAAPHDALVAAPVDDGGERPSLLVPIVEGSGASWTTRFELVRQGSAGEPVREAATPPYATHSAEAQPVWRAASSLSAGKAQVFAGYTIGAGDGALVGLGAVVDATAGAAQTRALGDDAEGWTVCPDAPALTMAATADATAASARLAVAGCVCEDATCATTQAGLLTWPSLDGARRFTVVGEQSAPASPLLARATDVSAEPSGAQLVVVGPASAASQNGHYYVSWQRLGAGNTPAPGATTELLLNKTTLDTIPTAAQQPGCVGAEGFVADPRAQGGRVISTGDTVMAALPYRPTNGTSQDPTRVLLLNAFVNNETRRLTAMSCYPEAPDASLEVTLVDVQRREGGKALVLLNAQRGASRSVTLLGRDPDVRADAEAAPWTATLSDPSVGFEAKHLVADQATGTFSVIGWTSQQEVFVARYNSAGALLCAP